MKWIMQTSHEMVLGLKPLKNNFSMKIQVVLDVMLALFTNIYWPAVISDQTAIKACRWGVSTNTG